MLANLAELKSYLWITDSDEDTLLTALLWQADAFIKSYTGRDLEANDYADELYSWKAEREFLLKQFPVNSLTSFKYNTGTLWTPVWEAFDEDSYRLDEETWRIYLAFNLVRGFQNIQVNYNAWFETVPADLNLAEIRLAAYYFNTRNADWIVSESVDGASVRYDVKKTPDDILAILENYKAI